ncbi:MAG: hypothetical protein ACI8PZ_004550 [Myxococcota bacterium]|jgi:hypothetical protein
MSPRDRVHTDRLSRRQVLLSAGGAFALPLLASALPRDARADDAGPSRSLVVMAIPNGYPIDHVDYDPGFPDTLTPPVGRIDAPTQVLEPLHDAGLDYQLVSQLTWMSGARSAFGADEGFADDGHAGEFHALTGDSINKTGIVSDDPQFGWSVDQRVRDHLEAIAGPTAWPSLHLGCPEGAYDHPIAFRGRDNPMVAESDPETVFAHMFGSDAAQKRRRGSVLDFLVQRDNGWMSELSRADRVKLDQHLTAVRELENRLDLGVSEGCDPSSGAPGANPDGTHEDLFLYRADSWVELVPLAIACGLTRVATLAFGPAATLRTFGFLGWPGGYHDYSHTGFTGWDADKLRAMQDISRWHVGRFAHLATALAERTDSEGRPLLDGATLLLANGLGSCSHHSHDDHVVVVAGGGGGHWRPGRWHEAVAGRPYGDLLTTVTQGFGRAGRSGHWATGVIDGLLA